VVKKPNGYEAKELGYLTPQEFLKLYQQNIREEEMSLVI